MWTCGLDQDPPQFILVHPIWIYPRLDFPQPTAKNAPMLPNTRWSMMKEWEAARIEGDHSDLRVVVPLVKGTEIRNKACTWSGTLPEPRKEPVLAKCPETYTPLLRNKSVSFLFLTCKIGIILAYLIERIEGRRYSRSFWKRNAPGKVDTCTPDMGNSVADRPPNLSSHERKNEHLSSLFPSALVFFSFYPHFCINSGISFPPCCLYIVLFAMIISHFSCSLFFPPSSPSSPPQPRGLCPLMLL